MAGPRRDRPRTALAGKAQRNAMWMWGWLVAENVVEQVSKSLEHMFDSLRTDADGLQNSLQIVLSRRPQRRPDLELRAHPVHDRTREIVSAG